MIECWFMSTLTVKYIAKAANYSPSKWASIKLAELANQLTTAEIQGIAQQVFETSVKGVKEMVDLRLTMKMPQIILDMDDKRYNKALAGKADVVAMLNRVLKKRNQPILTFSALV